MHFKIARVFGLVKTRIKGAQIISQCESTILGNVHAQKVELHYPQLFVKLLGV